MFVPNRLQRVADRLVLGWALALTAFLTMGVVVPNVFAPNTTISASQVNANFASLKAAIDALEATPTLYGDGSGGPLAPAISGSLTGLNRQFSSITIPAGVTLSVPSGTVLRSTGPVIVDGAINVFPGDIGGAISNDGEIDATLVAPFVSVPGQGVSRRPAGHAEYGDTTDVVNPGVGGLGLGLASSQFLRFPGNSAGGGGAGTPGNFAGSGGGGLTILALGPVTITGTILASGTNADLGGGGGGGGVVVAASAASITLTGTIVAAGGAGGNSSTDSGAGGGGGGGIVILISPANAAPPANVLVNPGPGGLAISVPASAFRLAGAGGGACGGNGGDGGGVDAADVAGPGAPGTAGFFHDITGTNPRGLFP